MYFLKCPWHFKIISTFHSSPVQADLVLGELCGVNENRTINPAVDHCCKTDFAFRRHCFERLEADTSYALPSVSALTSALRADWCQAHDEDLQNRKHRYELSQAFL